MIMLKVRFLMQLLHKTMDELFNIFKISKEERPIHELLADIYRSYVDETEEATGLKETNLH